MQLTYVFHGPPVVFCNRPVLELDNVTSSTSLRVFLSTSHPVPLILSPFDKMRSSQKNYRSQAVFRHPPITPGASGPKTRNVTRAASRASTNPRSSFPPPASPAARQLRTPYQTTDTADEAEKYDSGEDDLGHVIAAIDTKDYGTVGCAYYSAEEEKLYLLGDSRSGGIEAIDACKSFEKDTRPCKILIARLVILQIKPTVILTSSRVEIPSARGREQSLAHDNGSLYRSYVESTEAN
jgi:DNA mismatch repair protein MSH5